MFKYISSILAEMSPQNRFKSLVALLLSIVFILTIPNILDAVTVDHTECQAKIKSLQSYGKDQYVLLEDFQKRNSELNYKIQHMSIECSKKIIQRDSYWTEQLKYIRGMVNKLERNDVMIYGSDTLFINPDEKDVRVKNKAVQNLDYLINKNK